MVTFSNLCNQTQEQLLACFNEAFSAYIIPLQLSAELFAWKLKSENFNPELSVGAFDGDMLVGFILHCTDEQFEKGIVYNGGTGVLEAYRGQQITRKMYEYALPLLKDKGYHTAFLEVIEGNEPAHQSYLKAGFVTQRVLACFKGNVAVSKYHNDLEVEEVHTDLYTFKSMATTIPSWQNAHHTLNRVADTLIIYQGRLNGETVAYLVYNPILKRIHQLAVSPSCRRQGIGSAMMHHLQSKHPELISVINVDSNDAASLAFLEHSGLDRSINLFEMEMPIN